jgi:dTDP-4-amino-4,6-dideoxygalactose transaminase
MTQDISLLIPSVPNVKKISKYLKRIDKSRIYSNFGPLEGELRQRLADIWRVPSTNIVTACNATLALQGAIETSECKDEAWKVPSWTFVATPLAIYKAGRKFEFVDIDPESWRAVFSTEDENIVDVLPFGDDLDLSRFRKEPLLSNLVIDGAASFAALSKPLPKSNHSFALVVSLHATKLLPAGEGAVMVTNNPDWANRFRAWTNFGFTSERSSSLFGTNAKLSEYSAAVALASLDNLRETEHKLSKIQKVARQISSSFGYENHPAMRKGLISPYWIVQFKDSFQKDRVIASLSLSGIPSREWWGRGCHKEPIFELSNISLPQTDYIASTSVGLPMHIGLSAKNLEEIKSALARID